jgi:hypothetical protein
LHRHRRARLLRRTGLYWLHDLAERVRDAGFAVEAITEATHYCLPFLHFLVYGIGKPLLERGWLPAGLRDAADRLAGEDTGAGRTNLVTLAQRLARAVDRLNDRPGLGHKRTFVSVLLKARKPDAPGRPESTPFRSESSGAPLRAPSLRRQTTAHGTSTS